jgi:hypothetical protein
MIIREFTNKTRLLSIINLIRDRQLHYYLAKVRSLLASKQKEFLDYRISLDLKINLPITRAASLLKGHLSANYTMLLLIRQGSRLKILREFLLQTLMHLCNRIILILRIIRLCCKILKVLEERGKTAMCFMNKKVGLCRSATNSRSMRNLSKI